MSRRRNRRPKSVKFEEPPEHSWVPHNGEQSQKRWGGYGETHYDITVGIPWCATPDEVIASAELCLLQQKTGPILVVLVDMGSNQEDHDQVEAWARAQPNVEQHTVRMLTVKHPSDFPAIAMDLVTARCQSRWMWCTHADVFLKRRDVIHEFVNLAILGEHPAVGYQISERPHPGWKGMISHTATLLDMDVMLKLGMSWNQRRFCLLRDIPDHHPRHTKANMPDTEHMLNQTLRDNGIKPHLVDADDPIELNQQLNEDHRLFHARSLTSAKLIKTPYYEETVKDLAAQGLEDARERIAQWSGKA